jgi:hypothetical protein
VLSSWTTLSAPAESSVIQPITAVVSVLPGLPPTSHLRRCRLANSRSFESREICDEIIRKFHGQPIGEEGLLLQVRYADTPAQKDLKRVTSERRQFRTNEYNVGAYGGSTAAVLPLAPPLAVASPILPRASQIARHLPSRVSGSWKRETHVHK